MAQKNNILEELRELNSSLPHNIDGKVFAVPEGYFETFPENLMVIIRGQNVDMLPSKLETPFSVPAGYFDQLQHEILAKVASSELSAQEEINQLSPLLAGMSRENPYSIPDGYFSRDIRKPAKVISITRKPFIRYAAAAMITALIALSVIFIRDANPSEKQIMAGVRKDVRKMDDKQIDSLADFIDAGLTGSETAQVSVEKKDEVKEMLKGVSEEELKLFEQQNADLEDVILME